MIATEEGTDIIYTTDGSLKVSMAVGLTITEAINSGKRFKRKDWSDWVSKGSYFYTGDIIAIDCEVEERKITVTEHEFDEIVKGTLALFYVNNPSAWDSYSEEGSKLLRRTHDELKRRLFEKAG